MDKAGAGVAHTDRGARRRRRARSDAGRSAEAKAENRMTRR